MTEEMKQEILAIIQEEWAARGPRRTCLVKYPPGAMQVADGKDQDHCDVALELAAKYAAGESVVAPSGTDENGSPQWEIIPLPPI